MWHVDIVDPDNPSLPLVLKTGSICRDRFGLDRGRVPAAPPSPWYSPSHSPPLPPSLPPTCARVAQRLSHHTDAVERGVSVMKPFRSIDFNYEIDGLLPK
jgi:hypothetical protein